MLPSDYPPKLTEGIWSGKKVSVIMTYYANRYDKIGGVVGLEDNQHISVYAQRLRDVIEVIKHNTGKNKVIIIAHSMGGLVSREYIKNYGGINSVSKLITIGTPNHGTDAFTINTLCGILHPGPECEEMTSGSDFLIQLNTNDETPGEIKFLTIIGKNKKGTTCPNNEYWDNVICSSSVYLNGAENYYYEDFSESYSAISNSLHTIMVHPSKAPDVYNKIVEFLNSN
jgi:triacylglycerol esterase/lipase EstA (alpha/beta hydrolase family)